MIKPMGDGNETTRYLMSRLDGSCGNVCVEDVVNSGSSALDGSHLLANKQVDESALGRVDIGYLHHVTIGVSKHYDVAPYWQLPFVEYVAIGRRRSGCIGCEYGVVVWEAEVDIGWQRR